MGNLITVTAPMGGVTTDSYDELNLRVSVTDALNNVTSYAYDANSRRISVTDADGSTTTYWHCNSGDTIHISLDRTLVMEMIGVVSPE